MVFVKKSTFFPYVSFEQKSHKETFFDILDRKKCFLNLKGETLAKSKKSTFCKGVSPWFLSKYRPFFICFFFGAKEARKKHFFIFLIERMLFRPEKLSSNKVKDYRHFVEGLVHGLCQKIDLFLICFFFSKKSQKETFFDILETKECFLDHKRKVLRNCKKNRHFAKGSVQGFYQKIDLFLICFF